MDNVIVDKLGWASITRRNMEILDIAYGDLFYIGLDLDECNGLLQSLIFIKVKQDQNFSQFSEAVKFNKRQLRGGFQLNSVLRLLRVRPPFICDIHIGDAHFDFSLQLPDYKAFTAHERLRDKLMPWSGLLTETIETKNTNLIYEQY